MAESVYIETSVPSAHVSTRTDHGSQHRLGLTRRWWSTQLALFDCSISDIVSLELSDGEWPGKSDALRLVEPLPRLPVDSEIVGVAQHYIAEQLMPAELNGDAMHLAVACVHEVDFLLTWNIRHLANPNKVDHLMILNRRLGLATPQIVTPEQLWMEVEP